jgi:hypothetical protein
MFKELNIFTIGICILVMIMYYKDLSILMIIVYIFLIIINILMYQFNKYKEDTFV